MNGCHFDQFRALRFHRTTLQQTADCLLCDLYELVQLYEAALTVQNTQMNETTTIKFLQEFCKLSNIFFNLRISVNSLIV